MTNVFKLSGFALSILFVTACTLGPSKDRHPAGAIEAGDYRMKSLSNERILQYSSTGNLEISELKILTDNTDSLEGKLDVIRNAKSEIAMMYYIYGVDESSSYLSRELLKAANERNVKVRILVDFFVNYKNYDHFRMLEEKSNGNIQVSFYGVPQGVLLESMSYLASPCKEQNKTCVEKKWKAIKEQHASGKAPFFTRLLVAGMYGKSADLVKIALSEGSQINLSSGKEVTADEKKQLLEFLELVFRAKVQGDVGAKLKLAMALAIYGTETLPIYEKLLAVFPLAGGDKNMAGYWENATDFIHHKLILSDNKYIQIGGRNIEDSYHMSVSPSGKYTFLDTDVYAELKTGGSDIKATFDKMWNFSDTVKPLRKLDSVVTHDFAARENLPGLLGAIGQCKSVLAEQGEKTFAYATCVEKSLPALAVSMNQRVQAAESRLISQSAAYDARKIVNSKPTELVMNDANPFITYLENLSFTKKSNKRLLGSGGDKNITEMWVQSIKNTCKEAIGSKVPQEITFLNAYVFMPAAVYSTIGDILTGKLGCGKADITIATNSMESTDLGVINIFANYQFLSLARAKNKKFKGTFKILEMNKPEHKTTYSLHSKVSVFGNDLIIGSANADVRSYHMDSNNAFFIRSAPQLTSAYKKWISDFINPAKGKFTDKTSYYQGLSFAKAQATNGYIFDQLLLKYGNKLSANGKAKVKQLFLDMCKDVYDDSQFFLSMQLENMDERQRQRLLQPRIQSFDSKYQVF